MPGMMSKLKLTVNETKTRLCHLPDEPFDFLGYTLGRNCRRKRHALHGRREPVGSRSGHEGGIQTPTKSSAGAIDQRIRSRSRDAV